MVILIQNYQNRKRSIQVKLDELIRVGNARNSSCRHTNTLPDDEIERLGGRSVKHVPGLEKGCRKESLQDAECQTRRPPPTEQVSS
jgi:hypothetical protein